MSISELFTPVNARYTIPALVLIMYALYRLVRYQLMHPKSEEDESLSPEPQAPGTQHQAPSPEPPAPSPKHQAPSTQHQAPSTEHQAPSPQHQAPSSLHDLLKTAYEDDPVSFASIGEFAMSRGAIVEAHFWFSLAKIKGVKGVDNIIRDLRKRWIFSGRPTEAENLYDIFGRTRNQAAFAYIAYCVGFSASINKKILDDISAADDPCVNIIIGSLKCENKVDPLHENEK